MSKTFTFLMSSLMALGVVSAPAEALNVREGQHPWCGTDGHHSRLIEAEATHRWFEKLAAKRLVQSRKSGLVRARPAGPTVRKANKVAVIEDDGSLISERNPFDNDNNAVIYKKKKTKVRALKSGAGINQDFGERISNAEWGTCNPLAEPGDDASIRLVLPFKVKFYGKKYKELFINSDGTVTFDAPDCQSSLRSLGRVLSGPPMLAGFFADLDPGSVSGERGVFVKQRNKNLQITWNDVPSFGFNDSNTFQITVFKSKILIAFGDLFAREAVVGASPGGGTAVELVDLTEDLPVAPTAAAILERYSLSTQVDDVGVAKAFFSHFKDDYDHLIMWMDFPVSLGGAFAYEINIKNDVQGIGLIRFDLTDLVGSDGRLESLVQMGRLDQYPADTMREVPGLGTNNTMDVLGQETGHRWLAFVNAKIDGQFTGELLGRDPPPGRPAHWSFFFDSDESDMEGNDIMDLGGGLFQTVGATSRFSALDQYLMGLIPPEEVGPMFFVRNASNPQPDSAPQIGVEFGGQRVDITVDNIIDEEGPRVPSSADAAKSFKMAFVLVARTGEPARQASIDKLNGIAKDWVKYFEAATDGNGKIKTSLKELK